MAACCVFNCKYKLPVLDHFCENSIAMNVLETTLLSIESNSMKRFFLKFSVSRTTSLAMKRSLQLATIKTPFLKWKHLQWNQITRHFHRATQYLERLWFTALKIISSVANSIWKTLCSPEFFCVQKLRQAIKHCDDTVRSSKVSNTNLFREVSQVFITDVNVFSMTKGL